MKMETCFHLAFDNADAMAPGGSLYHIAMYKPAPARDIPFYGE